MEFTRRSFGSFALLLAAAPRCVAQERNPVGNTGHATDKAAKLIEAAREQIGVTLHYDPAYTGLAFPNGDVPRSRGVCTDVIIRAYRDAFGADLQALVNADMKANFAAYPKNWGLRRTDRNIDHRRVPNLRRFLTRQGARLPLSTDVQSWQPGDIFTSLVGGRLPHIGIVSDKSVGGIPLVIHNIGSGAREEDRLFTDTLNGHYRWRLA
ncbi:MAG: DUF1287 domain-containing protein [Sphingorhabdus sp.]